MIESYYVHESSIIDNDVKIGNNTKIWHFCHVQNGAVIGENCTIGQNVYIGKNVKIGNNVKIQNNVSVYEGVSIEDNVFIGPSVVFTNDPFPRSVHADGNEVKYKETHIEFGASIGANATVVCGHTVGKYALVAAGAVVTKNVAPYILVAGIPARQKRYVCECGQPLNAELCCDKCRAAYSMADDKIERI